MNKQTFTRKELYDLVWSEPMLSLSRKYNISDVGLRKTCIRMNVPMPKAGHWQKLKFGKKIKKVPLPDNYQDEQEVSFAIRDKNTPFPVKGESPLSVLKHQIESDSSLVLKVPDKLTNPDKLIVAARESLNRKEGYPHHGLISCLRGELDIRVTKENISRTLRFMDVFIKAMRARGHEIIVENNSTYAVVKTQKLEISLREKTKRIPGTDRWQTSDYQPTGQLVFKLDRTCYDREWMDGKLLLEDQLPTIIAKLELISAELNERELVWQKQREERERQEKLRKAYEEKQQKDLADFKDVLLKAARWHKAVNLRNYIDTVEQKAINSNNLSEEQKEWLAWARKKADWYDPFIESPDTMLCEVDRESLTITKKGGYNF